MEALQMIAKQMGTPVNKLLDDPVKKIDTKYLLPSQRKDSSFVQQIVKAVENVNDAGLMKVIPLANAQVSIKHRHLSGAVYLLEKDMPVNHLLKGNSRELCNGTSTYLVDVGSDSTATATKNIAAAFRSLRESGDIIDCSVPSSLERKPPGAELGVVSLGAYDSSVGFYRMLEVEEPEIPEQFALVVRTNHKFAVDQLRSLLRSSVTVSQLTESHEYKQAMRLGDLNRDLIANLIALKAGYTLTGAPSNPLLEPAYVEYRKTLSTYVQAHVNNRFNYFGDVTYDGEYIACYFDRCTSGVNKNGVIFGKIRSKGYTWINGLLPLGANRGWKVDDSDVVNAFPIGIPTRRSVKSLEPKTSSLTEMMEVRKHMEWGGRYHHNFKVLPNLYSTEVLSKDTQLSKEWNENMRALTGQKQLHARNMILQYVYISSPDETKVHIDTILHYVEQGSKEIVVPRQNQAISRVIAQYWILKQQGQLPEKTRFSHLMLGENETHVKFDHKMFRELYAATV
jgi:hypothetical protein